MPRRIRELEDQAIYHIYSRGNNRQQIFKDHEDYRLYLALFIEARNKYPLDLYHYCLMPNHIHVLLRIAKGSDLPKLMHWIQLGYARLHQKKYDYKGHLFQGRFRSPKISDDSYYIQCGRYIERNPLKAHLADTAAAYPWSSASYYTHGTSNSLITPNVFYTAMGKTPKDRQKAYRKFVAVEEPYHSVIEQYLKKT